MSVHDAGGLHHAASSAAVAPAWAADDADDVSETARHRAEAERAAAERRRSAAVPDRGLADRRREDCEESRQVNEEVRASAEMMREQFVAARGAVEILRGTTEAVRHANESLRHATEQIRAEQQATRARADEARREVAAASDQGSAARRTGGRERPDARQTATASALLRRQLADIQRSSIGQRQADAAMRRAMQEMRTRIDATAARSSGEGSGRPAVPSRRRGGDES